MLMASLNGDLALAVNSTWATFQIMRRTHASLSRQAGIDPKLVADQLDHRLGVNLEVYTVVAWTNVSVPFKLWKRYSSGPKSLQPFTTASFPSWQ